MRRRFFGIPLWIIAVVVAYFFKEKLGLTSVFDKLSGFFKKKSTSTGEDV